MARTDMRPKLQALVDEFVRELGYQRHPLVVSAPYYPYDDPEGKQTYPNSDEPGCYVFSSGDGKALDVGKAANYMGNRIWAHIGRKRRPGEAEPYPDALPFVKENQPDIAVWAIAVPDAHWWVALALEGFLTEKFIGTRKT